MSVNEALLARFVSRPTEHWPDVIDRVSSISTRADRQSIRELLRSMLLLPSGQILRGAGIPDAVLASCTVASSAGRKLSDVCEDIARTTRLGVGVGINISRLPSPDGHKRTGWLRNVVTAIAQVQERNARAGISRTATGIILDWADVPTSPHLADLLASAPLYRHLTLSVRVPLQALADDPESCHGSRGYLLELAAAATRTGMPGVIFPDHVDAANPYSEETEAANPCVEQHLSPDETCILATINLAAIFRRGEDEAAWSELIAAAKQGIRLLADAVEASEFPSTRAAHLAIMRRRLGLGVTGFATALQSLGIPYDSTAAVAFAAQVGEILRDVCHREAAALRSADGLSTDAYRFTTSIPPTGAVAKLALVHPGLRPPHDPPHCESLASRYIEVVSVFQRFVDNGISATVPLPATATPSVVLDLLTQGATAGCKGLSVYPDGAISGSFAEGPATT